MPPRRDWATTPPRVLDLLLLLLHFLLASPSSLGWESWAQPRSEADEREKRQRGAKETERRGERREDERSVVVVVDRWLQQRRKEAAGELALRRKKR